MATKHKEIECSERRSAPRGTLTKAFGKILAIISGNTVL